MKKILFLLACLPVALFGQIPSLTDNSQIRFRESNSYFSRPLSDLRTSILPSGTTSYTMRYTGSAWAASSLLLNDGSTIGIGATPTSSYRLTVKQTTASTSTDGIFVERFGASTGLALYHNGSATMRSIGGNNMSIETESGSLLDLRPGGGGGQLRQVGIVPLNNVTTALGNAAMFNVLGTYAPTTAGGDFSLLRLGTTVNITGSGNQRTNGLLIVPTVTSAPTGFYGIRYGITTQNFLWQPQGNDVKNRLAGDLSVGVDTTLAAAKVQIQGDGNTSSTYSLIVTNSSATTSTAALAVRDDGRVAVGTNSPGYTLDVVGTDAIKIPVGSTAQRPTGARGVIRFNNSADILEYFDGTDWQAVGTGGGGVTDHGALTGLSDDDHTQYLQLAGRATGQVATGGTASGDDLTLRSTTNATKGNVFIQDQGGNVTIGGGATASALELLEPSGSGTNKTTITAQAQAADINYTLPAANAVGVLQNDGSGGLAWGPKVITPSNITVTQNDYAPTGWATANVVRLSGNSSFQKITGFSAGVSGEIKTLINVGSSPLYIAPEHSGSTAANRVSHYEEVILAPGTSAEIMYDATLSRWTVFDNSCENYLVPRRATHYDKYAGKFPEGITEDVHLQYAGSGNVNTTTPTSALPVTSWSMDNASAATGDKSLYLQKTTDALSYAGGAHIVTKAEWTSPNSLSSSTQRYRIRHVLTASPASLLTNVNQTIGIRYSDDINSGKLQGYTRNGAGSETTVDLGVTLATSTTYTTAISFNKAADEATFFVNGVCVGRLTATLPATTVLGAAIQYGKLVGTSNITFYCNRLMGAAIMP